MAENSGGNSRSWWLTLPGMLTAIAALITALGGLIVALHQVGVFGVRAAAPNGLAADSPAAATSIAPPGSAAAPAVAADPPRPPPPGLSIISHSLEPRDDHTRTLRCRVRMLNDSRYPANFSGSSFRLLVDGIPQAPTNMLNDVVAQGAASEGEVVFVVPARTKSAVLRMQLGDDVREHTLVF
jgi:hypothetical protein